MADIKFGTDGWRAIIALDFTVENVRRVAFGTAVWLKSKSKDNAAGPISVCLGPDIRFGGKMFAETTALVLAAEGIRVHLANNEFVSTPMISYATARLKADAGVIITASHNPPAYNGYKIKASYGGPATPSMITEVEKAIPETYDTTTKTLDEYVGSGLIVYTDYETMYIERVREVFDLRAISQSGLHFAYDAMYGAGQNVMRDILPDLTFLHAEHNPGFHGQAPEPIEKNLHELKELLRLSKDLSGALITDGDADRIGMFDGEANFIDSHHLLLLLIHYLHHYKGQSGHVISTFSCTSKIEKLCKVYDLPHTTTKIGFKYICDLIVEMKEEFLVGGEESGGIALRGHIPERDGIWVGLIIWEFMVKSKKTMGELIQEIYDLVGAFAVERYDLTVTPEKKESIIEACKKGTYGKFGSFSVTNTEDMDGFKFHLKKGNEITGWVMIRPSGTEPVLRVYAEAETSAEAFTILEATKALILA